jgi:peptidoglycan/LPS O-acetylase OafA/YrhL
MAVAVGSRADEAVTVPNRDYWPALDGLRAFAVLSVMAFHAGLGFAAGGFYGVDIFFPLSGFLITTILLRDRDNNGRIRFGVFYLGRALRLLPALGLVTIAVVIYSETYAPGWIKQTTVPGLLYVWTFLGNWASAFHWPLGNLGIMGHTWSLAVEEQFYWLWPIALVLILRKGWTRAETAVGLFLFALVIANWQYVTAVYLGEGSGDYWRTDTHSAGLVMGCALAFWVTRTRLREPSRTSHYPALLFLGGMGVLLLAVLKPSAFWLPEGSTFQISLGSCAVIWSLVARPPALAYRLFTLRPIRYVGRISYGLYLWHFPIYIAFQQYPWMAHHPTKYWILKGICPFAAASLSYFLVERPIMRLGKSRRNGSRVHRHELVPVGAHFADRETR